MKHILFSVLFLAFTSLQGQAPLPPSHSLGPVGFVNCNDGCNGITGGGAGRVVRVSTREELAGYAGADEPYVIIVEGRLEGTGLQRQRDVIEVRSDKTIVGVKGAELAGIGLNISGQHNIIIRNLIIHHADPDGIAARRSHHIWVDHCDIYSQDEAKREDWDGLIDLTQGSSYLTVSYCHIHDHHKACLLNSGTMHWEDNGKNRATYHHNAFIRTDQRNPRIGYGLGHVFCNYYEDIGSYAIGMHTQARVLSEHNWFGSGVRRPFAQMYANSCDEASCAFFDDRGSRFARPLPEGFKTQPTGTDFRPAEWYDYDFALDDTAAVASLFPWQTGPVEGLEYEPVLWPGNGATGLPLPTRPRYGNIENLQRAEVFWGTSPDDLKPTEPEGFRTPHSSLITPKTSPQLRPATTYYWYVRAHTTGGTHTSPLYRFTTAGIRASRPCPANGATDARLRSAVAADDWTAPMDLSWQPAADARNYKVYLSADGKDSGMRLIATTPQTRCNPGTLLYGTAYSWRVDVETAGGETIQGEVWTFSAPASAIRPGRTEAEHLARSAYVYPERQDGTWFKASNDTVMAGEAGPGALTGVWDGPDGSYEVSVSFMDEKSGQARMAIFLNDRRVDTWTGMLHNGMTVHRVPQTVTLHKGDQIRLELITHRKMRCRIDCIGFEFRGLMGSGG